ncbi:MAG: GNAT family N-acetyltransferase, partial [Streptosporangiaceae bacterium]
TFRPSFGQVAAACRLAAECDEIAVQENSAGQTVIAILVAFEVAERVSLYQSARLTDKRWREASTVVIAKAISDACERGISEVDFLRGDEDYKRNFTSERRQLVRLRAAAGWLGRSAMTTDLAASKARALAVQAARRLRRSHH